MPLDRSMDMIGVVDEFDGVPSTAACADRASLATEIGDALVGSSQVQTGRGTALLELRLTVPDDVMLETDDAASVVLVNLSTGSRVRVSPAAYRFMHAFREPRRVSQVLSAEAARKMLPHIKALTSKRLLIDADAPTAQGPAKLRAAVAYKFCNAPRWQEAHNADFVILGVPYDLSSNLHSRLVPDLIRQKSLDFPYRLGFDDGLPLGWFDADRELWILRGATFADGGNVLVQYGESKDRSLDRVTLALAECVRDGSVPVILGGDHSITRAALAGMATRSPVTVVRIVADAHLASMVSVERDISKLSNVAGVSNVFPREQRSDEPFVQSAFSEADAAFRRGSGEPAVQINGSTSIYLSIDLGSVAASMEEASGPSLQDFKILIAAAGAMHRIAAIDLVGLDTRAGSSNLAIATACQLALTAMDAAHG